MSPFGKALHLVAHDREVHQYLKSRYWSRASKTQKQRLSFEEKALKAWESFTEEQKRLALSVSHIWNHYQRQR